VTVTTAKTSNVGVKVELVGKGVMDAVDGVVRRDVCVEVVRGDGVAFSTTGAV
jgi:hypothetical protein